MRHVRSPNMTRLFRHSSKISPLLSKLFPPSFRFAHANCDRFVPLSRLSPTGWPSRIAALENERARMSASLPALSTADCLSAHHPLIVAFKFHLRNNQTGTGWLFVNGDLLQHPHQTLSVIYGGPVHKYVYTFSVRKK